MSTKVYNAFVLTDSSQLWPVLRRIRIAAEKAARDRIDDLANLLSSRVSADSHAYKETRNKNLGSDDWEIREHVAWTQLDANYREVSTSLRRSPWDFDVSLSVREHQGNFYLIAHEGDGMRGTLVPVLEAQPELMDFHYQNCTDRPEEVPEDEWASRAAIWGAMTEVDVWWDYLSLDIVCWGNWWRMRTQLDRLHQHCLDKKGSDDAEQTSRVPG